MFLANADGVILLASVPSWSYRTPAPLTGVQREQLAETRQFTTAAFDPLDWIPMPDRTARMEAITRQLKFFARPDPEPFELFDLREAMKASLALLHYTIEAAQGEVEMALPRAASAALGQAAGLHRACREAR